MTTETSESKKLKVDYFRMQVGRTSDQTVAYSRLMYIVSGGVLALILGAAEFDIGETHKTWAICCGLLLIAIVNFGHGFFVLNQRDWSSALKKAYKKCVGVEFELVEKRGKFRRWLGGSKQIYAKIHFSAAALAFLCFLAAVIQALMPPSP